jgi:hypothetical protein
MICRKIYKLEKNQQDVGVFTQIRINGNNKNYFNENQIVYIENENKPVGCLRVVYYLDKQKQNNFVHVALAVVFKEFRQQGYFGRLVEVLKKLIAQKSTEENILFQHLQFTTKHEYIKNMLKAYKESTIESKIDTNGNEKFECRVSLEKNIKPTLKEMI